MKNDEELEDITIRRADSKDMDTVCELWASLANDQFSMDERFALSSDALTRWRNDYPMWVKDRSHLMLLANTPTAPVGFIHCRRYAPSAMFIDVSEVYVEALFVRESYRRRGLGHEFVEMAREWSIAIGAERMRFNVLARNTDGRSFWAREGADSAMVMATIDLNSRSGL
ncbi:MAG: GNAT family N-acetyltransferase [Rhodothermales bacterium]|nr:GNAT family N-acetyltransferase [Rhodothermales bacterium]